MDFPLLTQRIHDKIFQIQILFYKPFKDQVNLFQEFEPDGFRLEGASNVRNAKADRVWPSLSTNEHFGWPHLEELNIDIEGRQAHVDV